MAKKKLKKTIEAGFIPGIYNYCDRWCEKCNQQSHCISFILGKKMEAKGVFHISHDWGGDDENLWIKLKKVFELTYDALCELADERGVDIEEVYASEDISSEFLTEDFIQCIDGDGDQHQELIVSSDIVRICLIYESLADKCLEKIFTFFDLKVKKKSGKVEEALEIVEWYLDLIQAKSARALTQFYREKNTSGDRDKEKMLGAAKVALIAIERSVAGWQVMFKTCPNERREIGHLLVVLEQLRIDVERQFPTAKSFQRPGFELIN